MSISINNNDIATYAKWIVANTDNQSETQETSSNSSTFKDLLQISTGTHYSAGNYENYTESENLTTDQKTAFLENMLNRINSENYNTYLPEKLQTALSTISDVLSDYDSTTSTEEQTSELFAQVTEILESSKPSRTEMLASGSIVAPTLQISEDLSSDNTEDASNTVSVDLMKQIIANFIANSQSEEDSNTSTELYSTNLISGISDYDASSTSEDAVTSLYEMILNEIQESLTENTSSTETNVETEATTESFPDILQMTGVSLPPFNWKPSGTTTV